MEEDRRRDVVLPPVAGGPPYEWREKGVNAVLVAELVCDISLTDHLLMRGLSALLRSNMAWRHQEIAEAGQLLLYVALDASFQLVLRVLRERGLQNPSALDAGALIDEVFNPHLCTGATSRISTTPGSRQCTRRAGSGFSRSRRSRPTTSSSFGTA